MWKRRSFAYLCQGMRWLQWGLSNVGGGWDYRIFIKRSFYTSRDSAVRYQAKATIPHSAFMMYEYISATVHLMHQVVTTVRNYRGKDEDSLA